VLLIAFKIYRCKKRFVTKEKLLIKSPPFEEEGLKDICVKNPDKKTHLLPKIILYSDEYFKLTSPNQRLEGIPLLFCYFPLQSFS